MNKTHYSLISLLFILFSLSSCHTQKKDRQQTQDEQTQKKYSFAKATFSNICSGCHGEKVETFVDRKWKYGNTKDSLMASISNGYADLGMPGFKATFSEENIRELADFILQGIENNNKFDLKDVEIKSNIFDSGSQKVRLDTIAKDIKIPWGMAFLPNGEMLITERSGKLYKLTSNQKLQSIDGVPEVVAEGQGGLLDIALHSNFKDNHIIYLSYAMPKKTDNNTLATTAVMKAELVGNGLTNQDNIFVALPFSKRRHHYGSRLQFGNDGKLYISVGDRGNEKENPQSLNNFLGKIHRINDDGSIPQDNPFVNQQGAIPSIYSYGHRNPQGMTLNPSTGEIWVNEHGPRGGDEINIIRKGKNYGWPVITYGINYNGKPISNITKKEGMEQPEIYWTPSIAPSGIAFVSGDNYKKWEGDVLTGSLRFRYLNRTKILNNKITGEEEILLKNIGRLRNVKIGNDGFIYIAVEASKNWTGGIFKLVPIDN
ncbi:PQQ-dependent sugar dehydrogenase [Aestuariivivens insulae]|uniref:PQQ-dependent sugar dehydrogenase n=1 Tax=Aestuariivivens insulae TaxID=1621988 RepID=UPI001F580029|nr:PQQ-dependent sugar dehydrogenase [Aestuariivivens insulae]